MCEKSLARKILCKAFTVQENDQKWIILLITTFIIFRRNGPSFWNPYQMFFVPINFDVVVGRQFVQVSHSPKHPMHIVLLEENREMLVSAARFGNLLPFGLLFEPFGDQYFALVTFQFGYFLGYLATF